MVTLDQRFSDVIAQDIFVLLSEAMDVVDDISCVVINQELGSIELASLPVVRVAVALLLEVELVELA